MFNERCYMTLPTQGVDAHGCKIALEPTSVVMSSTVQYVQTYHGYSYNNYVVELLDGEWPSAETLARKIDPAFMVAYWSLDRGTLGERTLVIYID